MKIQNKYLFIYLFLLFFFFFGGGGGGRSGGGCSGGGEGHRVDVNKELKFL